MTTTPDNWKAAKSLFEAALAEDAANRPSFLKQHCTDANLRAEVERLFRRTRRGCIVSLYTSNVPRGAEAPTPRLSVGEVLAGRLRVIRFIAGGGMVEVYEAEDQELRERVAVKTIRPKILRQPNAVTRFKREVHLARKVTHPNVCRIFDLFRYQSNAHDETVFISMELLQGETLGTRLKQCGRMHVSEAVPLVNGLVYSGTTQRPRQAGRNSTF